MLPKLAFFNTKAVIDNSLNSMRNRIESVVPGIQALDAIGMNNEFHCASSVVRLNRLHIAAHAHDPISVQRTDSADNLVFVMPFAGAVDYKVGKKHYRAVANDAGLFLSGEARSAKTEVLSEVIISLDKTRLKTVAQIMSGNVCYNEASLCLNQDRRIKLNEGGQNFSAIFNNLFSIIDVNHANQSLLDRIVIEDMFYRAIGMLLDPDLINKPDDHREVTAGQIDLVCDFIRESLRESICMTDLQRISGLSARSLQYAFAKKFSCSPMEWVREQRLYVAHELFRNATDTTTVSGVSAEFGFFNFGNFARLYKKKFGELPSDTIKKSS